jgi:hypothetical protein
MKPVSKEDSLKEVKPTPAIEPKKRMRHLNGSFLTSSQVDTEEDNIKKQIA